MAKYEVVAKDIISRIKQNEFETTLKLPTEDEMIEYYQVSRNTVRSALKLLTSSGYYIFTSRERFFIFVREAILIVFQ